MEKSENGVFALYISVLKNFSYELKGIFKTTKHFTAALSIRPCVHKALSISTEFETGIFPSLFI